MSLVKIDPYTYKARSGRNVGQAKGILYEPIFAKNTFDEVLAELNERSYENEIHQFVKKLMDGIGSIEKVTTDGKGETHVRECYYFNNKKDFACNYLLFDCIEMLLKAEITINVLKSGRMDLLEELYKKYGATSADKANIKYFCTSCPHSETYPENKLYCNRKSCYVSCDDCCLYDEY